MNQPENPPTPNIVMTITPIGSALLAGPNKHEWIEADGFIHLIDAS